MSTFPKLKRLENFDIPVYRNAHPQRNGKKRYFTHKNFVSSEYALAQDNYSDYLKYNLNIDPSELTSPDFTTQSG